MRKPDDPLWSHLVSFENLLLAYHKASRGKRGKPNVATFELHLEENLLDLQAELNHGTYRPGSYASFLIHEPKRRLISAAPFRDRVVHHALCNEIQPLFERKMIFDSYANRLKKGSHRALDRCTHFMRRFAFVLPFDIRQFFPSIDHALLLEVLAQTIADRRILSLCELIISSGAGVLAAEYDMVYFPGDDLLAATRPRGLPIGNLTSQFWANVYLTGFDQFVKRQLKCRGYIRYVDDFLLFSNDKNQLHAWHGEINSRLAGLRLVVHEGSAQPRPCAVGIPFLGFQVFPDHRRLKRQKVIAARRHLKSLMHAFHRGEVLRSRLQAGILGWINHARYGDTWNLRRSVLKDIYL